MKTITPISTRGFTLIELLLVVAILAILSTAVVIAINPAELLKQARDAIRLSDLGAVNKTLSISQVSAIPLGSSTIVYVSIPDISATCANLGLPALPTGWSYQCAPSSSYLNANGTGWIPVNFNLIPGGSSLGALPIDPVIRKPLLPGMRVASINKTSPPAGVQANPVATPGMAVLRMISSLGRKRGRPR